MGSTCAAVGSMNAVVGWRELRRQASELVRRVEAGEEDTITVVGRASARLVPVAPRAWRQWRDVAELVDGAGTPAGQ